MSHEHGDGGVSERLYKGTYVLCDVEDVKGGKHVFVLHWAGASGSYLRCRSPETAQIRGDDMVTCVGIGERYQHFAPGVGEFWEAVEKEDQRVGCAWVVVRIWKRFQDVDVETVTVAQSNVPRCYLGVEVRQLD